MLNRLTVALEQDPTIDMFTFLSPIYSKKLQSLKKACKPPSLQEITSHANRDSFDGSQEQGDQGTTRPS